MLVCQHCGSEWIVRNRRAPNGKQRFLCRTCDRQCRQNPAPRSYVAIFSSRARTDSACLSGAQQFVGAPTDLWRRARHGGRQVAQKKSKA
ncbi:transposase-like zinc-binding domain-containing protein [Methylocaldum szegediense]|uniref:transposase-like zinc-binding domain-containing protein n=1 Tax=Methylocaldum szegediense TaxID=73780 RepID=UPI00138AD9C5